MSSTTIFTHSPLFPGWILSLSASLLFLALLSCATKQVPSYQDRAHFSKVFKREKNYRLYLPEDYHQNDSRYPVVYFFHGWGGRYKSDDNAKLAYEKIKNLVDKYQVILVMWDGNVDEKEPRPYNIGNHEDVRYEIQMKDYFLELVEHVDAAYRTKADRNNRGTIGFSMGGFMSYFLAGKYPDKLSAAVGMTGSPEFFVGYPSNHTLYPLRYTFENLEDVKLRFHNSTADELTDLNTEVYDAAQWYNNLSFDYWQFEGGHVVDLPGETVVFEKALKFVTDAFKEPDDKKPRWSHYDLYSDFSLYGYTVRSSKKEPGFIYLSQVSKNGFDISTLKWVPDGPSIEPCKIEVTTAPLYPPGSMQNIIRYNKSTRNMTREKLTADSTGSLHLIFDEQSYSIGISNDSTAEFSFVNYSKKFLRVGEPNTVSLTLLNRTGAHPDDKIQVSLTTADTTTTIEPRVISLTVNENQPVFATPLFRIETTKQPPQNASPAWIRFKLEITGKNFHDEEYISLPVYFKSPIATAIIIDDGRAPHDSLAVLGKGNRDGVTNPGERVVVYSEGHKLRLYTDDPWVKAAKETLTDEVLPAKWPDGYTLTSVVEIDNNCPSGHIIEFIGNYETKEFMPIKRKVTWKKVMLQVTAK